MTKIVFYISEQPMADKEVIKERGIKEEVLESIVNSAINKNKIVFDRLAEI